MYHQTFKVIYWERNERKCKEGYLLKSFDKNVDIKKVLSQLGNSSCGKLLEAISYYIYLLDIRCYIQIII